MSKVVNFIDNSGQVKDDFREKVLLALSVIGEAAEGYAKEDCPVDTGRLRNSITYATANAMGSGDSSKHATPEDDSVYIGTNVEYAPYVEFRSMEHRTGKAHFLRDAAATHSSEYKSYAEAILKQD